jgi:hypothetical protein
MIEVRYKDRLGNNLFQYCLGRILAEELGFALQAKPIQGFPNTAEKIEGLSVREPAQILTGHMIEREAIRADRSPRRIVLDGWFQRYEYYRRWRDRIRQWLTFDPAVRAPAIKPEVVVHVRRADYVPLGWALPSSFYHEALETLLPHSGEDVWIVSDDRYDPFLRQFSKWKPKFFYGTTLETMLLMSRARQLVMSQSTFSWWPTFLGDADKVICPLPQVGPWSEAAKSFGAELIEKDRFICLQCTPYRLTKIDCAYQYLRRTYRRAVNTYRRLNQRSL